MLCGSLEDQHTPAWEQLSLNREDDKKQTLKMMDMSSSGKENRDNIILEKRNKKYKVQSMKRSDTVWL